MLNTLNLPAGKLSEEAQELLSQFSDLTETQKVAARTGVIAKVFPLVFGEDAAIESSSRFEQLRKSSW